MSKKILLRSNKLCLFEYFLLSIILIGAFLVRLYSIDSPLADWHSWRQADTSAVSRNFLKYSFDLLHPRFDDISNIPSGKENPQGWRMVEFPIYNFLQAKAASTFPQKSLEWWGRMISIIFSLGSLIFLYLITKKYLGPKIGLFSAFFFGFLPFNIFYSRVILPEPMMIFTSLGMIYLFSKWLEDGKYSFLYYLLSLILAGITFLLKPFGLFLFFPLVYLLWRRWQFGIFKKPHFYVYVLMSILPFVLWRVWIAQFPEGIPSFIWLLNEGGIRFKGAFFRWIFAERLGKLILGYWGLVFFTLGILTKPSKKDGWFFHWWLVAILFYFTVFAGGNVRHDYYQIIAIPVVCIFLAKGFNLFLNPPPNFSRLITFLLSLITLLFMFAFSWYEVRGFFNINHPEIVEAGKAVDRLVPKNAKVVAPYNGDTAFLYQTNRQGWPALVNSVDYLISKGANFYVSVSFDKETLELMKEYPILEKTDKYVILSFQEKK
ncbi:hypothetical protein COU95_02655 [Candidatus Shapirobacteria bacterium CG10_big_fil_rev_8_21_14_0_10_40_9]|uniref:Glycosyltransferase RgtA/B/C/D-like domain-containing protein n=1 Tax=Candidatus Shapirobacteria bacterium CG10_big_fil_rev_8_21_14_0_10_40_9 TaxID=1974888 RepID=A0A2M8L393_9BACT|nr:MAG: hypothetical protein COU95_02655 [Candidatus Shapirobacteria bacterium CG10_big_fil_rev_8_21_14_0_10_40_9]